MTACSQITLEPRALQCPRPQAKQNTSRLADRMPIAPIQQRMWRDWMRGVDLHGLSVVYGFKVAAINAALREQTSLALDAARSELRMAAAVARRSTGLVALGIAGTLAALMGIQALPQIDSPQIVRQVRGRRLRVRRRDSELRTELRLFDGALASGVGRAA